MDDPDRWPDDYFASRERFVELARACSARLASRPVKARGPEGEALSVDIATFGPERAEHVVVLTSGVHGVEGYLGAQVQMQAMRRLAHDGLPDRTAVALVHAVNPWGFAHLRRVDANNVDVNRNFLDPALPRPHPSDGYSELDPLINPRAAPDMAGELGFWLRASRLIARRRGIASLAKDIAEGQDRFPKGLFYSGTEAGESAFGLQDLLLDLSSDASRVTHLDLHSGLGRSGSVTLVGNTDIGPVGRRAENLRAHFRQPVSLDDNADNPYNARGTLGRWYRRAMGDTRWLYLCVEIGTANPLKVLSALKRENQAHHWSAPGARSYRETKRRLLDVFAPHSSGWRRKSVAESLWAFERSLALPIDPEDDPAADASR